jgi:hypothetical protein
MFRPFCQIIVHGENTIFKDQLLLHSFAGVENLMRCNTRVVYDRVEVWITSLV